MLPLFTLHYVCLIDRLAVTDIQICRDMFVQQHIKDYKLHLVVESLYSLLIKKNLFSFFFFW